MAHDTRQSPQLGVVKRLVREKGFGFLQAHGVDWFFHRSALGGGEFDRLAEGDAVYFTPGEPGTKGPRAATVAIAADR